MLDVETILIAVMIYLLAVCVAVPDDPSPRIGIQIGVLAAWARVGEPMHWWRLATVTTDGAVTV